MRFLLSLVVMCLVQVGAVRAQEPNPVIPGIAPLVENAIEDKQLPGAVVLIGTQEKVLHRRAYGDRQIKPTPERMTLDTVFDLASLTKPVATGTSVLLLGERGQIEIQAPVSRYLPEFTSHGKDQITIHQLLTHTSGLIADNNLRDYADGKDQAWEKICNLTLSAPPGEKFIYSDVGFITLGFLVEKVSGQTLREFTQQNLFEPLHMTETGYLPAEQLQARSAPADQQNGKWIRGTVHDPRAAHLGGIAGHAGVFSTAEDLSRYARFLLNGGELDGVRVLQSATVDSMLVSHRVPGLGIRTWGWDRKTGFSSNRGNGMSNRAIGHGGFTGTGMWIDPDKNLYVIFLSNRLHPDGKGTVNKLIGEIGTLAVQATEKMTQKNDGVK